MLEKGIQLVQNADGVTRDDLINALATEAAMAATPKALADSTTVLASTTSYEIPWRKGVRLPLSAGIAALLVNGLLTLGILLLRRTADLLLWRFLLKRALIVSLLSRPSLLFSQYSSLMVFGYSFTGMQTCPGASQ